MSMRTPVELRNDAWDCLQRAEHAEERRDKAILLILAQGWASLADEMERLGTAVKGDGVAAIECTGADAPQELPAAS
jgi:hypothetical protein